MSLRMDVRPAKGRIVGFHTSVLILGNPDPNDQHTDKGDGKRKSGDAHYQMKHYCPHLLYGKLGTIADN